LRRFPWRHDAFACLGASHLSQTAYPALKPSRANADVVNVEAMAISLIAAGLVSVAVLLVLIASYEENGAERYRASLVAEGGDPELAVLDGHFAGSRFELDADVVGAGSGEDFAGSPINASR
jgi:hypothetical protein